MNGLPISSITAYPLRIPRDYQSARGGAGSPAALTPGAALPGKDTRYALASTYGTVYSNSIETTLVKIVAEDGTIGWGEAQAPVLPEVTAEIIRTLFTPLLLGQSVEPLRIRELLYNAMRVRGHSGGFYIDALSAIDCALWDIIGKQAQLPLYRLLGGPVHEMVPLYISGLTGETLEQQMACAQRYVGQGYTRFKIFLANSTVECLLLIEHLRKEFGDAIELFVDALWRLEEHTALAFAQALCNWHVAWLESPLAPEDLISHQRLAERSPIPIAVGECYRTRHECLPWLQARAAHLLQPDIGRSGISEGLAIASLANAYNIPISIHLSIALGPQIAAAIHSAAAMPNLRYCELNPRVLNTAATYFDMGGIEQTPNGFRLPASAGLGVAPKADILEQFLSIRFRAS